MHRHVRMVVFDDDPDRPARVTEYVDAPATVPDQYVRSRIAPNGEGGRTEIITEFAPAPARPVSYPAALPFVAGRAVWTTESPNGATPEGARWPCTDPAALLETIVSVSIADGWQLIPTPRRDQTIGIPDVVLERDRLLREVQIVPIGERSMLQLWDVPKTLFHSPRP